MIKKKQMSWFDKYKGKYCGMCSHIDDSIKVRWCTIRKLQVSQENPLEYWRYGRTCKHYDPRTEKKMSCMKKSTGVILQELP